jgi:asparagine synthase (glutamine-hydrolysing)
VLCDTLSLRGLFLQAARNFPNHLSILDKVMRLDAMYTLPDDYLQKVDVATMAYSLESREPLLDHTVVEWAMKLPNTWKLKKGTNKYLLRKLAYRYIPKLILDRPKMGFGVPIDKWLRGPLRKWAEERFDDKPIMDSLMLDQAIIRKHWRLHLSGTRNVHPLLWSVLMLINFQYKYASN